MARAATQLDPGDAVAAIDPARAAALGYQAPVALGRLLRYGAAIASLAAAAIHASAISGHTFHWLHAGAFVAMTVLQAWWAYLVLRSSSGRVLLIGAAIHGAIVGLWVLTRTSGIPDFVPGGHEAEAVGLKDGVATLLAVFVLGAIDVLSRRDLARRLVPPSRAGSAASAFLLTVALLAVPAVRAGGHVHVGDDPADHGHPQVQTEDASP